MTASDPPSWPAHFAQELKHARVRAGYASQQALGDAIGWSRSRIADVESGRDLPPLVMVEALDESLGTDALLSRIWTLAKRSDVSQWIAEYFEVEERARRIRAFQPMFPPGLLQTRDTATAVLMQGRYIAGLNHVSVEERVELRMQRQRILAGASLNSYWVVIDEAVLRRMIGGPEVMKNQMRRYLDVIETAPVSIQVMPYEAGAHVAFSPFSLLDVPDGGPYAHIDGPLTGTTTSEPDTVAGCEALFDGLRSQAASLTDSAAMIETRMEEL